MINGASKKPSDNKAVVKKTFNSVAGGLFRELGKIFPGDPKLILLNEELKRMSKDDAKDHVPAMQFFKAMNLPTGMMGADGTEEAVVGELVLSHDPRLFSPECKAQIPQLDALDFKGKWAVLSQQNQQFVWGYLERMAQLSARVAALSVVDSGDVLGLLSAVTQAADKLNNGESNEEKIKAVMTDPTVVNIAKSITTKMR